MNNEELRAAMLALPEPVSDKQPPMWEYWRWDLWKRVTSGQDPALFGEWPCVYHTMLQNHWLDLMRHELNEMLGVTGYAFPSETVIPPENGVFDYLPETGASANLIHQLYHLCQWEKITGKQISNLSTIVEFGAGYGAMALLVHRLGFKGTYYIQDLPEFQLLQQYYLSNTGEVVNVEWIKSGDHNQGKIKPDLLIALYSLSEVDYALRDATLDNLKPKSHLLLYSNRFEEYDNVKYFVDTYAPRQGGRWNHWIIPHMPPESWYSIG